VIVAAVFSCRSNPFGSTNKSIEEFTVYTSDFTAQTDGGAKAALLEVINGAKATLNCAFSALTLTDVRSALVAKAGSGVQVKVAFDSDVKTSDAGSVALQASGAFTVVTTPSDSTQSQLLYGNNGTGTLRHNFCLADERYIYISTAAPDDAQMRKTPAVSLKIGSPQFGLARDFLREANMFSQLLFGSGKAKTDFTTKFTALDQVIGAYWGPQETPMDILGTELSEATKSVDFYSTAFQATNTSSTKSFLDVPTVLKSLETGKGLPLKKYFSSQALFDSASKAYTLNNPNQYINTSVTIGANIFVLDRGLNTAKTFIYTGSLRSQANSSDDSVLIELRGKYVAEIVGAYIDKIGAVSIPVSNVGDTGSLRAIVISEINWAGSYSDAQANDSGDNFLELYNTTGSAINISDWIFACTTNGTSVNSKIKMPPGATVPANGYFTIAAKNTGAFPNATYITSSLSISNTSYQCQLTNGKTGGPYYGDAAFTGLSIDTAGDAATAFNGNSKSILGLSDSGNLMNRSMERTAPAASGSLLTSWQTNVFVASQNTQIAGGFQQRTFGTPGAAASSVGTLPGLKINEIGVSSASNDFVEIYNPTGSSIDLASAQLFLQRDSSCDLTNGVTEVLALTGTVAAGGYYVVANSGHSLSNVNSATLGNIGSGYCLVLTATNIPIGATTNSFIVDWVTIAGAGSAENGSRAPDTGANGAISRMANGNDTNLNAADFLVRGASPGTINGRPTYSSTPASGAVGVAVNQNVILTFSESMNTGSGSVTLTGTSSGTQNALACAWSMTTVANDTCTVAHTNFNNDGETITVTLNSIISQAYSISPATTLFTFNVVNTALTPTVTNVVVASTNPTNGTNPFNTGTSTLTITGTNFTGATAVNLDDTDGIGANVLTALTSVTVNSSTQITATVPAGVRTNGSTGWNVRVTTPAGQNSTSSVKFVPRAGILISELMAGAGAAALATCEIIELYNPTAAGIDLNALGLKLRKVGGTSTESNMPLTFINNTIPASGFFLIVANDSTNCSGQTWWAIRDATYATGNAIALSGSVYISLSATADLLVIDKIGYGTVTGGRSTTYYEGTAVGALTNNNQGYHRAPNTTGNHSTDTDANNSDFSGPAATSVCGSATTPTTGC
jgi:hypothetical protein